MKEEGGMIFQTTSYIQQKNSHCQIWKLIFCRQSRLSRVATTTPTVNSQSTGRDLDCRFSGPAMVRGRILIVVFPGRRGCGRRFFIVDSFCGAHFSLGSLLWRTFFVPQGAFSFWPLFYVFSRLRGPGIPKFVSFFFTQ